VTNLKSNLKSLIFVLNFALLFTDFSQHRKHHDTCTIGQWSQLVTAGQLVSHSELKCMWSSSASTVHAVSQTQRATVLHGGLNSPTWPHQSKPHYFPSELWKCKLGPRNEIKVHYRPQHDQGLAGSSLIQVYLLQQCRGVSQGRRKQLETGGTWQAREREPITGVWGLWSRGRASSGVQGQSPWSGGLCPPEADAVLALKHPQEGQNRPICVLCAANCRLSCTTA